MPKELNEKQIPYTSGAGEGGRSVADNIRELTNASRQLFEAGKQMADNLSELSDRVEHATTVGSRLARSPWLLAGGAVAAGLLILVLSRGH